ncbi:MAG: hypothetical protein H7835_19590 [Magnetococcus sp. XQGC-1]
MKKFSSVLHICAVKSENFSPKQILSTWARHAVGHADQRNYLFGVNLKDSIHLVVEIIVSRGVQEQAQRKGNESVSDQKKKLVACQFTTI